MNIVISFLIILAVIALLARLYVINSNKIKFYTTGLDSSFRMGEVRILWKLAKKCKLENPIALYVSVPALNDCISKVIMDARTSNTINSFKVQQFLDKLYKFRTRVALDAAGKKGLESSKYLDVGQKLRIILPGKGVFLSKILNNGRELIIMIPKQEDKKHKTVHMIPIDEWVGKKISVYLWRKGDACYAFDTIVFDSGVFHGESALFLQHSNSLDRAQKRQSVRCQCEIYAQMYIIKSSVVDFNVADTEPGYKCLLEDISEDGAMIRIGGKGKAHIQIKLQFNVNDTFIMMYGVIRAVEYNKTLNQSRLHFECTHIDAAMKNSILTYVYNVLPQTEKEINEAMLQTEKDSMEDSDSEDDQSTGLIIQNGDLQ